MPIAQDPTTGRPVTDGLERGRWKLTPAWLPWKPKYRREVYTLFGPRVRWEYTDTKIDDSANFSSNED